jgi:hypothetical protein
MLVSLKPIGGAGSVNPADVTSIEIVHADDRLDTRLWVRGHAGYGTYSTDVDVSHEAAQQYLNDPRGYLKQKHLKALAAIRRSMEDAVRPEAPSDWQDSICDAIDCLDTTYDELENS